MNALVTAERYRLLARALQPPGDDLADTLREADDRVGLGGLGDLADDRVEEEHNRLFDTSVAVSPYETSWIAVEKGARLGQIAAFYQLFGVRVPDGTNLVDHVGTELEFAALLCVKEALAADAEQRDVVARARQVFVSEHLGRWVPRFAERLGTTTSHPFYAGVAWALADAVHADLADHGWVATDHDTVEPGDAGDPRDDCPMAPGPSHDV